MPPQSVVLCPCGKWHTLALRATEKYRQRLECGLYAILGNGVNEYRFKGEPAKVVEIAAGHGILFILLEQG